MPYIDFASAAKQVANLLPLLVMATNIELAVILDGPDLRTTRTLNKYMPEARVIIYELNTTTHGDQRELLSNGECKAVLCHRDIANYSGTCDWLYLDLMTTDCIPSHFPVQHSRFVTITFCMRSRRGETAKQRIDRITSEMAEFGHFLTYYFTYCRKRFGTPMCQLMYSRVKRKHIYAVSMKRVHRLPYGQVALPISGIRQPKMSVERFCRVHQRGVRYDLRSDIIDTLIDLLE